jgi:hypothetical protein
LSQGSFTLLLSFLIFPFFNKFFKFIKSRQIK